MKNNICKKLTALNNRTVRISKKMITQLIVNLFSYVLLIALSGIFLAPFIYMVGGSFMSAQDLADPNVQWIPTHIVTENYRYAYMTLNYLPRLAFSFGMSAIAVFGQVLSSAFVGYALARFRLKLNGLLFTLVILSLIIPPQTIIVSQYLMFSSWGMSNSWWPIILPCFFSLGLNGGLFVFIFRQAFKGMPKELENAAMIDGLGFFRAFLRIILPSASSSLLITSILSFIWQWNNYFEPSIYIRNKSLFSLTMMLESALYYDAVAGGISYSYGITLASLVLISLPIILMFFLLQRRFIKGIETAGLAN